MSYSTHSPTPKVPYLGFEETYPESEVVYPPREETRPTTRITAYDRLERTHSGSFVYAKTETRTENPKDSPAGVRFDWRYARMRLADFVTTSGARGVVDEDCWNNLQELAKKEDDDHQPTPQNGQPVREVSWTMRSAWDQVTSLFPCLQG